MSRTSSHHISTKATDLFRTKVDNFYANGDALFREITERDYGIDGIIELFENGCPTGKIALIQIKGTDSTIVPLKSYNGVSCQISLSNVQYALQTNVPVILVYISTKDDILYYLNLNEVSEQILEEKINNKNVTVRIPNENMITEDFSELFSVINSFYEENNNVHI